MAYLASTHQVIVIYSKQMFQCSDAAQKRFAIESLITPITGQIQEGINMGQGLLQQFTQTAADMTSSAISSLQNVAKQFNDNVQDQIKKAAELGKNVTSCFMDSATQASNFIDKASKYC